MTCYLKPSNAWQNIERLSDAWKIRWLLDEHINLDLSKGGSLKDSKKTTLAKIAQYAVLRLINFYTIVIVRDTSSTFMRASAQIRSGFGPSVATNVAIHVRDILKKRFTPKKRRIPESELLKTRSNIKFLVFLKGIQ